MDLGTQFSKLIAVRSDNITSRAGNKKSLADYGNNPVALAEYIAPPDIMYARGMKKVNKRITLSAGSAGFGAEYTFRLDQSVDLLHKLIFKQTYTESAGVAATIAPLSSQIVSCRITCGGVDIMNFSNAQHALTTYYETHGRYHEQTARKKMLRNDDTALNNSSATLEIELNEWMPWGKTYFPINKRIISGPIEVTLTMASEDRSYDTAGAPTVAISDPYLIQESWVDTDKAIIPGYALAQALGKPIIFPYVDMRATEVTIGSTSSSGGSYEINFANSPDIKEIDFTLTGVASYTAKNMAPITDAVDITSFYLNVDNVAYYPTAGTGSETTVENLYLKRAESGVHPTGNEFYKINMESDGISGTELHGHHGVAIGHISDMESTKPSLEIEGTVTQNDRLTMVAMCRKIMKILPSGNIEIIAA